MPALKLTVDIRSAENGGQLLAKVGTVVDFLREQGELVVVQTQDARLSFPLETNEFEIQEDGRLFQEMEADQDALYMDRGKGKQK